MKYVSLLAIILFSIPSICQQQNGDHLHLPQVQFALQQIEESLAISDPDKSLNISFRLDSINLSREAYHISIKGEGIEIMGGDEKGLMYGGLEVAEQLTLSGEVVEAKGKPYIQNRGIKFNIPLDARTPSYDDTGDAAQKNYAEMWKWSFWEEFLDDMALHRYNTLTLWNPHPFPSMVKLPNFPDVALNDVCITTLTPIGKENEWAEPQMVSSNVVENLEVIKKMTIEEKIAFWQRVMNHAKDRGIDIYFFTWNLCANAAAKPVPPFYRTYKQPIWDEEPGKYGITNQMNNPINVDYYRESVKTFLLTYPQVKGIGVTAGEHMLDEAGGYTREQWIWEAYGQGIMDAMQENPGREINFIHRVWNTDMDKIMTHWQNYPGSFEASFKYAKARLYSSPYLNFADGHIEAMETYGLKSWWNLRNDDIFVYRWGDPEYVKAFIGHFQLDHTAGFYMGSDGYVWGREFTSKQPEVSGQLEIKKHWYNFMLWGRLSYDNTLDNAFFTQKLKDRFPHTDAGLLFTTWQAASRIIPKVNVFHWRDWDYQWSVEGCFGERMGFHDVLQFMENPTISGDSMMNPADFAKATLKGQDMVHITPLQVVEWLNQYAEKALEGIEKLTRDNASVELVVLLDDIKAMAYLGQYYALKIEAATALALFSETQENTHKEKAISQLQEAIHAWEQY
ncbi:MAG: hypothetical protein AAF694_28615, partial [Bacteroidota bacterium]